ncbi:MAG: response regulator [Candidatus Diapherotrites archaeon]
MARQKPKRILLTHEWGSIADAFKEIIQETFPGAHVDTAANANEVRKLTQKNPYDVIFLNQVSPPKTGIEINPKNIQLSYELLVLVRKRNPFASIGFLEGYGGVAETVKGIDFYINYRGRAEAARKEILRIIHKHKPSPVPKPLPSKEDFHAVSLHKVPPSQRELYAAIQATKDPNLPMEQRIQAGLLIEAHKLESGIFAGEIPKKEFSEAFARLERIKERLSGKPVPIRRVPDGFGSTKKRKPPEHLK